MPSGRPPSTRQSSVDLPSTRPSDELMGRAYGDNFDDEAICPITSTDEGGTALSCGAVARADERLQTDMSCSALPRLAPRPAPRSCARRAPAGSRGSRSSWPPPAALWQGRPGGFQGVPDGVSIGGAVPRWRRERHPA
ncbi:MAG: hypothetical protein ACLTDR_04845 [Adlercreutzia equolifaciens]